MDDYISISKAFSSSLVEKVGARTTFNSFVPINKIAELKGLKSTRSIRLAINQDKYIARKIEVSRLGIFEVYPKNYNQSVG